MRGAVPQRRVEAVARLVGHHQGAEFASAGPATWSSVMTITRAAWSQPSTAATVSQASGERELAPARPGQRGQPGLGLREYLDGHQH